MESEIKPRFIVDPNVHFHSQINVNEFEEPIPEGIVGVSLQEGGRPYVDVLDQEVAIYSRVPHGRLNPYYMAATISIEDALILRDDLVAVAESDEAGAMQDQVIVLQHDGYARARILYQPTVELWIPEGSEAAEGIVITSLITPKDRIPAVVVNQKDALRLAQGISEVLEQYHFRDKRIVDVLNRVTPGKVILVKATQTELK